MIKRTIPLIALVFITFSELSAQDVFPDSWAGQYKGRLEIFAVDSVRMVLDMALNIQPTGIDSVYEWEIIYDFEGSKDVRTYELLIKDEKKGWYQIDEKNDIIIDAYYRNGVLTSCFEVQNTFIIASYTKMDSNHILFEIIAGDSKAFNTTGGTRKDDEEIPEVKSYKINGRQKAVMSRE